MNPRRQPVRTPKRNAAHTGGAAIDGILHAAAPPGGRAAKPHEGLAQP